MKREGQVGNLLAWGERLRPIRWRKAAGVGVRGVGGGIKVRVRGGVVLEGWAGGCWMEWAWALRVWMRDGGSLGGWWGRVDGRRVVVAEDGSGGRLGSILVRIGGKT